MKKTLLLLLMVWAPAVAVADECVDFSRAGWPQKFQTRSVAGPVGMIAGDQGVDAVLNPGIDGGRVYQDGFQRVCLHGRNPRFDLSGVTAGAMLEKLAENEALNADAEAQIKARASAFDALTENEKVELIKARLGEK